MRHTQIMRSFNAVQRTHRRASELYHECCHGSVLAQAVRAGRQELRARLAMNEGKATYSCKVELKLSVHTVNHKRSRQNGGLFGCCKHFQQKVQKEMGKKNAHPESRTPLFCYLFG